MGAKKPASKDWFITYAISYGAQASQCENRAADSFTEVWLASSRISQSIVCDCSKIDAEIKDLEREIEVVIELSKKAISENARIPMDQDEFNERNDSYLERHRKATEQIAGLQELKGERQNKYMKIEAFIKEVEKRPLVLEEFDEKLWLVTMEKVTVKPGGKMVFEFKDSTEIEV